MSWIVRMLGVLAFVLAVIVLWRISENASVDRVSTGEASVMRPIGTSTLSHGTSAPHPGAGQPSADPARR